MIALEEVEALRAKCAALEDGIRRGTEKLTAQLLSGADTSALRDALATLAAELDGARKEHARMMEELMSEKDRELGIEAGKLAAEAARRLKRLLSMLQPPPPPSAAVH